MQINPIEFSEIEFNWSSENGLSQIWKSKIVKSKLKILENWQFEFNEKKKKLKINKEFIDKKLDWKITLKQQTDEKRNLTEK